MKGSTARIVMVIVVQFFRFGKIIVGYLLLRLHVPETTAIIKIWFDNSIAVSSLVNGLNLLSAPIAEEIILAVPLTCLDNKRF